MIRESVTIDEALELLNRANEADPDAMRALVDARVPCNQKLADDPTIQVGRYQGSHRVGVLGILCGLFGVDDESWGAIGAELDVKTKRVARFVRTTDPRKQQVPDRLGYKPKG